VDLVGYMAATERPIDVVLTWKRRRDSGSQCAKATDAQLASHYRLVHQSQPRELLQVWRFGAEAR
jgi:hypothetical protein